MMGFILHPVKVTIIVFTLLFLPFSAIAAPQILAVASTNIDVKMHCMAGQCTAELSAICLQENRSSPYAMTEYYMHGDKKFTLSGKDKDGTTISLPELQLKIVVARGHNAVRVSFPERLIRKLDAVTISVSVPENVVVIPKPIVGDGNPQTEFDIAIAAGNYRPLATRIVDQNTKNRVTAELVNHAINALPIRGRADPSIRNYAKDVFMSVAKSSGFPAKVKQTAVQIVNECHANTTAGFQNYRQCLGSWHDMLIGELNTEFWDAAKTGS